MILVVYAMLAYTSSIAVQRRQLLLLLLPHVSWVSTSQGSGVAKDREPYKAVQGSGVVWTGNPQAAR
jgi:hypothetical protein